MRSRRKRRQQIWVRAPRPSRRRSWQSSARLQQLPKTSPVPPVPTAPHHPVLHPCQPSARLRRRRTPTSPRWPCLLYRSSSPLQRAAHRRQGRERGISAEETPRVQLRLRQEGASAPPLATWRSAAAVAAAWRSAGRPARLASHHQRQGRASASSALLPPRCEGVTALRALLVVHPALLVLDWSGASAGRSWLLLRAGCFRLLERIRRSAAATGDHSVAPMRLSY